MSDIVRWENPPPHGSRAQGRPSKYAPMAAALRDSPNQWALVLEDAPVAQCAYVATQMRRGASVWRPAGSFEARQIGAADAAKASLYARYVGGAS